MSKYLYLTRKEWVATWTDGGQIPLNLASAYRASERSGTKTPDEVIHRQLHGISDRDFERIAKIGPGATAHITVGEVVIGGQTRGRDVQFIQRHSDGLILCLSNSFSADIMRRLNKEGCVEIVDWRELLHAIDEQLKVSGIGRAVEYTQSSDRDHFLKSVEDAWQDEFRLFWPVASAATVQIQGGLARTVPLGEA